MFPLAMFESHVPYFDQNSKNILSAQFVVFKQMFSYSEAMDIVTSEQVRIYRFIK